MLWPTLVRQGPQESRAVVVRQDSSSCSVAFGQLTDLNLRVLPRFWAQSRYDQSKVLRVLRVPPRETIASGSPAGRRCARRYRRYLYYLAMIIRPIA